MAAPRTTADRPTLRDECTPDIGATPEMIEPALPFLYAYHPETGVDDEETIKRIWHAMFQSAALSSTASDRTLKVARYFASRNKPRMSKVSGKPQ